MPYFGHGRSAFTGPCITKLFVGGMGARANFTGGKRFRLIFVWLKKLFVNFVKNPYNKQVFVETVQEERKPPVD